MAALVVERTGAGVIVRAEEAAVPIPPPFTLADGRTQIYIDEAALPVFDQLEPEVLARLRAELRPEGVGLPAIRLLSPRAGLAAPNGSRPLALRLAEALDVEVVAPDGDLVMLRGGELFSAGEQTGWVGFRPGASKTHDGPRYPIPEWQDGLSTSLRTRPIDPRISITPIPAGVWVRAAGQPARPHSDVGFRLPLSRNRLAVVVGAPGEPQPATEALAAFVSGLPAPMRDTFGLIGYGPEPVSVRPVAQQLAELLGQAVHGCHAVPQYLPEGGQTWLVPDETGDASWLPFVLESTYQPGVPPTPRNWLPPVSGLTGAGAGTFWLQDGWLVDVLATGLLVRPVRVPIDPVASRLPISPDAVNLVVSSAAGPPPERVLTAVERLASELPAAARERLRLVATPHAGPDYLGRLAASLKVDVHVLGTGGPGPAVAVAPNAPLRSHPWEAGSGVVPTGLADGQPVAWIPAPPSGVAAAPSTGPAPAFPQPGPSAPAVAAQSEPAAPAAVQHRIRHQPTEPLRIVSPVTVDAEGRMRPTGDGWQPGEPGAPAPAVPTGNPAAPDVPATPVVPVVSEVSGPPVPASLGPATPLPQLSQPQSTQVPEVSSQDMSAAPETGPAETGHAVSAPGEQSTSDVPESPVAESKPVVASAVSVPVTASSVQIPVVASSTPLPSMKRTEPEPDPEPAAEDATPEPDGPEPDGLEPDGPEPAAPETPKPAPVVPPAPVASGPTPAPIPPTPTSAPVAPVSRPAAPAAAAAAAAPGPAPIAPAAANRAPAPAPVLPPVHAPAPVSAAVPVVAAATTVVAAVPNVTADTAAAPAVETASPAITPDDAREQAEVVADDGASESVAEQRDDAAADQISSVGVAESVEVAADAHTAVEEQAAAEEVGEAEQVGSDDQVAAAALKPLLLKDHSSTEEDRQQFKKSLGWKYDAATRSVTRLLAERPGLRGGMPVDDVMLTELAAVHVFATSDQRELVNAIRTGDAASHYPFISCLAGGLRRLPSLQGLVVRGGPGDAEAVADYVVGSELIEPAPMLGVSDDAAGVPGSVELLIWSVTARRLGGLAADENAADVVFPPATSYRVLAVEADAGRVLLTEVGKKQRSEEARQKHDARVLERLTEAAKHRDEKSPTGGSEPDHDRYSVLLGEPANPFATPAAVDR
ncbi:hypothetical protein QFW96_02950 [Saccharopolyspora sp. TS4A08]|uniref:Uncharacterized protein n=1 Tax=Saccharopolyspora ipomoeae TaxID=3042027 RepID=A0ABT6PHX0_9PSEU|nr:hypothetical protein [Saccharopolyspora sp. TS4A08]MDI2027549.1 hypothetical protein [Saccharopolyspora sp. TS4A08]